MHDYHHNDAYCHSNNRHHNRKPLQVFTEQSWPLDAFCAAVQIMDKFLDICCHILRSQLQVSVVSHLNHSVCSPYQLQVLRLSANFTASKTAPSPRPNALLKFAKKLAEKGTNLAMICC